MQEKKWQNKYRSTLVCIDDCTNGVLSGRLYNQAFENAKSFNCLMDFLIEMEHLLDEMKFPQSFLQVRTFQKTERRSNDISLDKDNMQGKCATFSIRVLFRQNASWQGFVTWLENGEEISFRSVLELLMLINSVTCGERAENAPKYLKKDKKERVL